MEEKRKQPLTITSILSWVFLATFLFIVCLPILASIYEKNYAYRGWQTVTVHSVGTFQVPGEWIVTQYNNVLWLTDKPIDEEEYVIYFVGVILFNQDSPYANNYDFDSIMGEYEYARNANNDGARYSGGRSWFHVTLLVDDVLIPTNGIMLSGVDARLHMIAWDNAVDRNTVIRITKSFEY